MVRYILIKKFELQKNINFLKLIFNQCFEITYIDGKIQTDLKLTGKLSEYLHSANFLLAAIKDNGFIIGEKSIGFSAENFDLEALENNVEYLKNLQVALSMCNAVNDLELCDFSEKDYKHINSLINIFVNKVPFKLKNREKSFFFTCDICKSTVLFVAIQKEGDKYELSTFPPKNGVKIEYDKQIIKVSPYITLKRKLLKTAINLDFSAFLTDIKKYPISHFYLTLVNQLVLEIISAYDENKKDVLLNTAFEITKWAEEVNEDKSFGVILHLNELQCKFRLNILSEEDEEYLYALSDKTSDNCLKYACNIILKDKIRAKRYFDKLSTEEKEFIKAQPIYTLETSYI